MNRLELPADEDAELAFQNNDVSYVPHNVAVEERGDDGVAQIKELTSGLRAHSVIEAEGNVISNRIEDHGQAFTCFMQRPDDD